MPGGPLGPARVHPLAIVSLITGLLSMPLCCCWTIGLPFPLAIAAVVCGIIAIGKVKSNPQVFSGTGLAIAGIICGGMGLVMSTGAIFTTFDEDLRSRLGY